jgi:hypothetical protein
MLFVDIRKGPLSGMLKEHTKLNVLKTGIPVLHTLRVEILGKEFANFEEQ